MTKLEQIRNIREYSEIISDMESSITRRLEAFVEQACFEVEGDAYYNSGCFTFLGNPMYLNPLRKSTLIALINTNIDEAMCEMYSKFKECDEDAKYDFEGDVIVHDYTYKKYRRGLDKVKSDYEMVKKEINYCKNEVEKLKKIKFEL